MVVLGASIMDSPERLKDFSRKYGITFEQWRDPGTKALSELTQQRVIPRTVVLDKSHRIVLRELGYTEEKFAHVVHAVEVTLGRAEPEAATRAVASPVFPVEQSLDYQLTRAETIANEGSVGFFTTVAVDVNGSPAVACKDYGRGALLVSSWSDQGWLTEVVDAAEAGWSPSIAFDSAANPGVSYGAGTDQFEIRYATRKDGVWQVEVVDDQGRPFKSTSLVYADSGEPFVSYFASDDQDLRLAHRNMTDGRWTVETVDAEGDVGTYTSLQLNSRGWPMIAYYDEGAQDLKFASWDGGEWQIELLDSVGQVGLHCSLSLDPNGEPAITYFDLTNESLKLARRSGSEWSFDVIDSAGTVGQRCSLEFDSTGDPVVSYFGNGTLKLASWHLDHWERLTVDSSGLTGNYTSLALDANDNAQISYFDVTNADLRFAWVQRMQ